MALDFTSPLTYLETLCEGLSSVQNAVIGAPESLDVLATVYIGAGGFTVPDKYTGAVQLTWRIQLFFAHATDGNERASELALAAFLTEFIPAYLADRRLNGTVDSSRLEGSVADDPLYSFIGAEEVRLYPLVISVTQRAHYANQGQ